MPPSCIHGEARGKPCRHLSSIGFTDRGLCGGLNVNLFRRIFRKAKALPADGGEVHWCLIGKKASAVLRDGCRRRSRKAVEGLTCRRLDQIRGGGAYR